jgi:hypothetical protein
MTRIKDRAKMTASHAAMIAPFVTEDMLDGAKIDDLGAPSKAGQKNKHGKPKRRNGGELLKSGHGNMTQLQMQMIAKQRSPRLHYTEQNIGTVSHFKSHAKRLKFHAGKIDYPTATKEVEVRVGATAKLINWYHKSKKYPNKGVNEAARRLARMAQPA